MEKSLLGFLFLPVIFISIFLVIPIAFSVVLSFCNWLGYGPITFVGLKNFAQIFAVARYQRAFLNNILWVVGTILVPMFFGLIIAYLLSGELKGKRIFTGLLWIPYAVAPVALGYMFTFILDYKVGLLNSLLRTLGLESLTGAWLSGWPLNTIFLIFSSFWNRISFSAIIYLAGITTIPRNIVDAAKMDGSAGFHSLRKIIFPVLRPFTVIILTWSILYSFQDNFGFIWVMTGGGPYYTSETLGVAMYREAFMASNMGIGSALSFLSMIIVLIGAMAILPRSSVER